METRDLNKCNRIFVEDRICFPAVMFYLYWMTKPFYLFTSGRLQVSDIFLSLAFIGLVCSDGFYIKFAEKEVIYFAMCVFLINSIYVVTSGEVGFAQSTLYYLYNVAVILFVTNLGGNIDFFRGLRNVTFLNLLIQFLICILGFGKMYWESRYEGTFNDPNQFGFSVLTMFFVVFLIDLHLERQGYTRGNWMSVAAYAITLFLILKSVSTGMLMSIGIFTGLLLLRPLRGSCKENGSRKMLFRIVLCACAGIGIIVAGMGTFLEVLKSSDNGTLLRVAEKLERYLGGEGVLMGAINERGIDKLYRYPSYLLWGSGEGMWSRFTYATQYEVHSTFSGILFYYGIVPTILLLKWVIGKWRQCDYLQWTVFVALIAESFTLANQRQPAFWVLLLLPSVMNQCEYA